jgi:aspartyl-tRNA(Asn)/glutamyl-tRNA(Gln) amidotransferase subunit B
MQEGSLRCDANVNIHITMPDGTVAATPIVEVKNLNSFRAVEKSIKYEAQRQYDQFLKDGKRFGEVPKCTAGWDDQKGATIVQRRKEEASDYRYFPEPDLVPVKVTNQVIEKVRANMGELPSACRERLVKDYALSRYDSSVLVCQGRKFTSYFEETAKKSGDAKASCNWITNQVLSTLNEQKKEIQDFSLSPDKLASLVIEIAKTGLNMLRAREVYARMLETGEDPKTCMDALGFKVVGDVNQIIEIVRKAIAANPKAVVDFRNGKLKAADALKGAVMRETKGMAKMETVQEIVMKELADAKDPV